MTVLFVQLAGLVVFVTGTLVLGILVRRKPDRANAERLSRVGHGLFYLGLVIPQLVGIFSPGLDNYDDLLRQPNLPNLPVLMAMGAVLLLVGLGLYLVSFKALGRLGKGLAAFRLTRELAEGAIYQRCATHFRLATTCWCSPLGYWQGRGCFSARGCCW